MQIGNRHDWTARDDAIIIEMWLSGETTSAIGLRLGVSKNAVIGHKRKLSLPGRPSPIGKRPVYLKQETKPPAPAVDVKRKRPSGGLRSFPLWKSPELPTAPPAPISGGVLYESLPRGCCNWMLNDARPWRACGAPAGRVYCGEHTRQASARLCTRVVVAA